MTRRPLRNLLSAKEKSLQEVWSWYEFQSALVDEIFLTIAPKLFGGQDPLTIIKGPRLGTIQLELRSLVERDGELFVRYGVARSQREIA